MYKAHATHLMPIAFVIYLFAGLIAALLGLTGNIGAFLGLIVSLFAGFLLQAALTKAVQAEREDGAEFSVSQAVQAALPYLGSVAIASILAIIGIGIGLLLLIVPGLILLTIWAVFIPVIVIERSGALASFGRSQQLVRGRGWNVFGTLVLVYIIQLVAGLVLGIIFYALPYTVRDGLGTVISGTLIAPYIALVVTLIYYRLRGDSEPAQSAYPGDGEDGTQWENNGSFDS